MDASSHLGSSLVHRLLHRGYTVHAALHSQGELKTVEGLSRNNKSLKVFKSDPFDFHSITEALKGCYGLFYTFEPPSDHPTYDESMAEIEVRAAHNVLEACAQTDTIEKVVFTSSVTAVIWNDNLRTTSSHFDERSWSDINTCKKFKLWHGLSKTLAEKTAWALAMDRGINMVSINGGLLMSPDLTVRNPYLKGSAEMYGDGVFVTVNLSFMVDAHICIFEEISAFGRYLCFDHIINSHHHAIHLINMLLPPSDSQPPQNQSLEETEVYQQRISCKKLNELMLHFRTSTHL